MPRMLVRLVGGLLVLFLSACATKRDVVVSKIKGRGAEHVYPVTIDQAWTISKTILELEPSEGIEEHRADGYMLANDSNSSVAPTTYMGVFIERDVAGAKVTFVTRRRTPMQSYASLTGEGFHRKFVELLALVAAVGPSVASKACTEGADAGSPSADHLVSGRSGSPSADHLDAGID